MKLQSNTLYKGRKKNKNNKQSFKFVIMMFIIIFLLLFVKVLFAQDYVPGILIVKMEAGYSVPEYNISQPLLRVSGEGNFELESVKQIPTSFKPKNNVMGSISGDADKLFILSFSEDSDIEQLANWYTSQSGVIYAVPNYYLEVEHHTYVGDSDTNYQYYSKLVETDYGLGIHIPQKDDIIVAVIGNGIQASHEALSDVMYTNSGETSCSDGVDNDSNGLIDDCVGFDFTDYATSGGDNDPSPLDGYSHETSVAGVLAGKVIPEEGFRGITGGLSNIKILNIQAGETSYTALDLAMAIQYAADSGAKIINMSLGLVDVMGMIEDAVEYSYNAGCLNIVSAGNTGTSYIGMPQHYDSYVYTVTGLSEDETSRHEQASYQDATTFAAPFSRIYSPDLDNSYTRENGTSLSAPIVSALASLVWGNDSSQSATDVINKLKEHAIDLGDSTTGSGKIDVKSLVESYVTLETKYVETDMDGGSIIEVEMSKNSDGSLNKAIGKYVYNIEDNIRYSLHQELDFE